MAQAHNGWRKLGWLVNHRSHQAVQLNAHATTASSPGSMYTANRTLDGIQFSVSDQRYCLHTWQGSTP